ncbi:MAG: sigma-54-dependent Fis family transcriptional regulator, partial [Gemmatimonadetes bacterium]|nr:sigma-54-dependent Fis family transcriptional regulator [Gemmatimonadota bacterium]
GTGKELAARLLHAGSDRASGPFVPVNCAAIPEALAESELFGHERGSFTGATEARAGRFEQADGGTLFLDEIGSMPVVLQAKLLRVLQDRVVERVGGGRPRRVDVRVLAATNRALPTLVEEGTFRDDLYHRLNVLAVELPPLRERREDVLPLALAFRDRAADRLGVPAPDFSRELIAFLEAYPFPGNVRELENLVARLVALSEGETLDVDDLPAPVRGHDAGPRAAAVVEWNGPLAPEALLDGGPVSFAAIEERLLREAVRRAGGNLSEAARLLGLSYKTMRYRARKFGVGGSGAGL